MSSLLKCPHTSSEVELLYSCGIAYLRHFEGKNKMVVLQNESCMCLLQNIEKLLSLRTHEEQLYIILCRLIVMIVLSINNTCEIIRLSRP